ncbi:BtrH N-terminal domain-containing protein [Paenibacillus sp. KACC 21273]|uniref:BtrH N-terminal domain-containing protein n=1 Tax=Paenibacillus sp. KACC 21273 TaxID=3025665 RepID=UPI0023650B9B|nr:BtrH N-terminal domain-containing protein [Paenibacillus sp. KACC 21273]WDF50209.1 BtrH N-terminal domain-containing protein [Paenibacillus sp. KACC 21273]
MPPFSNLLDLKPLSGFDWSCFNGNIATAVSYFGDDYLQAFAHSWTFSQFGTDPFSYDLLGHESYTYEDILKYANTDYTLHREISLPDALNTIYQELEAGRPVLVKCDSFACPWFPDNYHALHNTHFFIIVNYDPQTDMFACTDVSYMTHNYTQSVADFSQGFMNEIMTFSPRTSTLDLEDTDIDLVLLNIAKTNLGLQPQTYSIFEAMRVFADQFEQWYQLAVMEMNQFNPGAANKLHLELLYIIQSRMQFLKFVEYRADLEHANMQCIRAAFTQSIKSWSVIRMMYLKLYEPKANKEHIFNTLPEKIKAVAAMEEDIAYTILHMEQMRLLNDQLSPRHRHNFSTL